MVRRGRFLAAMAAALLALPLSACGGGSSKSNKTAQKPPSVATPQSFPAPNRRSIAEIRKGLGPGPVLAPAVSILPPGKDRFSFGLFDRARRQISEAPTALYISPIGSSNVQGPIPAQDFKLDVDPTYRSKTVSEDPNAAQSVYVSDL